MSTRVDHPLPVVSLAELDSSRRGDTTLFCERAPMTDAKS